MLHAQRKRIVLTLGTACATLVVLAAAQRPTRAQSARRRRALQDHLGRARSVQDGDPAAARRQDRRRRRRRRCCRTIWRCSGFFKVLDARRRSWPTCRRSSSRSTRPIGATSAPRAWSRRARPPYGSEVKFEFRLFEVAKGDAPVLSKDYRGPMAQARQLVHQFANEVVKYYTGEDGFFASKIAFAAGDRQARRDIIVMDWDGYGADGDHQARRRTSCHRGRRRAPRSRSPRSSAASPTCTWCRRRAGKPRPALGAARPQHGRRLVARRQQDRRDAVAGRQLARSICCRRAGRSSSG